MVSRKRPQKRKTQRPAESYRGKTPEARAAQAANLRPAPPAAPGNQLAVTHGGRAAVSEHERAAKVSELQGLLADAAPIRDVADTWAIREAAETLVRLDRVRADIDAHGWKGAEGEPRPVVALEHALAQRAWAQLGDLGMNPQARVRMGLDVAQAAAIGDGRLDEPGFRFGTDPGVRDASRELVRRAAAARDNELCEFGKLDSVEGRAAVDDGGDGAATEGGG